MGSNFRGWRALVVAGALVFSGAADAQQVSADGAGVPKPDGAQGGDEAGIPTPQGGYRVGPLVVYPTIGYQLHRNDNIFQQAPGSGAVQSDTIQVLRLGARVEGKQAANTYTVGVASSLGRYGQSHSDNFNNVDTYARVNLRPDTRVGISLTGTHTDAVDPRGSTNDPLLTSPNKYRQDSVGGVLAYGAPGAQGRIELELGGMAKRYVNNRQSTFVNDRSENYLGGTYYWRIAPKTSILGQIKETNIDYVDPASTLDSKEMRYFGGVTWEATAATTGIVKAGQVRKDFKDSTVPGTTAFSWEADIKWAPLTYSTWSFMTSKTTRETTGNVGSFILATNYMAQWNHAWTGQFSTTATGTYETDTYKGIDRNDTISGLGMKGTYRFRRWVGFGADFTRTTRASNVGGAEFTKNLFMLFVDVNL